MTEQKVTLEATPSSLLANKNKSLTLSVKSVGYQNIRISGQIGDGSKDLMTKAEFGKFKGNNKIQQTSPKENASIKTPSADNTNWYIDVTFAAGKPWEIALYFPAFKASSEGITTLRANNADVEVASVDIQKTKEVPRITSFTSNEYTILAARPVTLSWKIEPESSNAAFQLFERKGENGSDTPVVLANNNDRSVTLRVNGVTDYTLKLGSATSATPSEYERHLRIHAFGSARFDGYSPPLLNARIFGLYAHQGSDTLREAFLLALVEENNRIPPAVSLWKTALGFPDTWTQVDATSFIERAAARRPGIVFKDKLWLVGGDGCDPGQEDFNVGFYDLTQSSRPFEDLERDGRSGWPAERMGHALVTPEKDHLWVMGGYSQNGGARNDIWDFDGDNTWNELAEPPWQPRCLFGATVTSNAVWIAGGFNSPGGKSYDDIWRYDRTKSQWERLDTTIRPVTSGSDAQYCGCALFALNDKPCVITTYYLPEDSNYVNHLYVLKLDKKWVKTEVRLDQTIAGMLRSLDYYRLDSNVFNGMAFLRALTETDGDDKIIYFVFPFGTGG
jgi:Kelch motif